ncbi:MAG: fimbrillin family protein [Bacteroidaceae bacterium]|nr:fimbrillin family protein [Bacteroidaceae bacterium]
MLKKYCLPIFVLALSALCGCDSNTLDDIENEVQLPLYGYIHFDTQAPTRAGLVEDMKRNFGVMGYSWEYNDANDVWNTVKVQATPNEFYATMVKYSDGLHSYDDPLVPWKVNCKYTFFGYYPHESESDGSVAVSGANVEGTPYLTYTLPTDPAKMQDVMTASVYNTDYRSSREVALTFKHRLAAVDVQMINLNAKFGDKDVHVKLTDLKLNFTNLKYNKAKVWMDESMGMDRTEAVNKEASYSMATPLTVVPSDVASGTINMLSSGSPLILIPQEVDGTTQSLRGSVTFNLAYVDGNGDAITLTDPGVKTGPHSYDIVFDGDLVAGRKHVIQLVFTRDAVSVQIIPPSEWTDNNVDIEFE